MHVIDPLHIHISFLYLQLISKIDIFWSNVDDFTVFLLLQNSSDFEICSLMWDNDITLNNKFLSVYRSSCMCRIPTQTYCKILLSMCVAMCMCIPCNIYVALGARGYLGFMFTPDSKDDVDMQRQLRTFYARSNTILR